MATRNFTRIQSLSPGMKIIAGSVSVDATADTATVVQGKGFSATHLDEGIVAIDLADEYPALIAGIAQVKSSSAADLIAQISTVNLDEPIASSKAVQDITYTSRFPGRVGNDLTVTYTAADAAVGTLDLTNDITLTKAAVGSAQNGHTFTLVVEAAAANPDDTILVAFTGDAEDIVCTVTPNDGTNNSETPVDLTTAELRELISTGTVVGKTVTLTDEDELRALQTATGGGATALEASGEGDGEVATFADGTGIAEGAVVTLDGRDIDVLIDDGVTTADAVLEAIQASEAVSYLVSAEVTGTGSDPQDAESAATLTGGQEVGLVIKTLAGSTATDADCEIHFQLYLAQSDLED